MDIDLAVTSGDVKEGVDNRLIFDVTLSSHSDYGSVFGSDLWDFIVYGSDTSDGSGSPVFWQSVDLGVQVHKSLVAGVDADFIDLEVSWDLSSTETCSDVAFICIDVEKNVAAAPDFRIEPSSVLKGCFSLNCRG